MTAALLFKGRAELDWAGCYDRLINRAVGRAIELVCYSERHHVIPRAKQAAHLRTKVHNRKQEAGVSGFNGVELLSTGRWRARVYVKRKPVHVGVYATAEEANAARIAFSVNK